MPQPAGAAQLFADFEGRLRNGNLNLRDEDLPLITLRDFRRVSHLKKKRQCFHRITPRLFEGIALSGEIELWAKR